MIRLLGRFVNEVAKTFLFAQGYLDMMAFIPAIFRNINYILKGLVTISGVSGFCLFYLFSSTTLNSGGFSLKYTHYFQFKLCRLTTDTEQFSLYTCTPVTKCKSIKELL